MSTYPAAIIVFPANTDNVTDVNAALVDLRDDEIEAIETELGLNPRGSYASVRARLDAIATAVGATSIAFTDGDTVRRVTITHASVTATSTVLATVQRPTTANDSADYGYIYVTNVVRVATGEFDVLVAALAWGLQDTSELAPNETITLNYIIR